MSDVNALTLVATVLVAVIGWIIALGLQGKNLKDQHRIEIRYDIYKQFVGLRKIYQNTIIKLATRTSPPLILMRTCMIKYDLKLTREFQGIQLPWSEYECVSEGQTIWNSYVQELYNFYFDFNDQHREMISLFEDWMSPLVSLQEVAIIMHKQASKLLFEINTRLGMLQIYQSSHGNDWRQWNEEEIKTILNEIKERADNIGSYSHDFTVLVHNELLSKFFEGKRPIRKTLDPKYKVLIKTGIIENLDHSKIKEISQITESAILDAKIHLDNLSKETSVPINNDRIELETISKGICPKCSNCLQVISVDQQNGEYCYHFICGHEWRLTN